MLTNESCFGFRRDIGFHRRRNGFARGILLTHEFLLEFTLGAAKNPEAFAEVAGDFRQAGGAEDDEADDSEDEPLRWGTKVGKGKHGTILPRVLSRVKRQ